MAYWAMGADFSGCEPDATAQDSPERLPTLSCCSAAPEARSQRSQGKLLRRPSFLRFNIETELI